MSGVVLHPLEGRLRGDERGWALRPLEAAGLEGRVPGDLHVVSLEPGAVRGNHRHDAVEWLLVMEGRVEVRSRAVEGEPISVRVLEGPRPALLEIPPGVDHAVRNAGERTVYLLAFSDHPGAATVKVPME